MTVARDLARLARAATTRGALAIGTSPNNLLQADAAATLPLLPGVRPHGMSRVEEDARMVQAVFHGSRP